MATALQQGKAADLTPEQALRVKAVAEATKNAEAGKAPGDDLARTLKNVESFLKKVDQTKDLERERAGVEAQKTALLSQKKTTERQLADAQERESQLKAKCRGLSDDLGLGVEAATASSSSKSCWTARRAPSTGKTKPWAPRLSRPLNESISRFTNSARRGCPGRSAATAT